MTTVGALVLCAQADFLRTLAFNSDGTRSVVRIAVDAVKARGPLVLWNGWLPQLLRIMPYATLQSTLMEKIAAAFGASVT